jgi:hypothetical protein
MSNQTQAKLDELMKIQTQIAKLQLQQNNVTCSLQKECPCCNICVLCKSIDSAVEMKTDNGKQAFLCKYCYDHIKDTTEYPTMCNYSCCPICTKDTANIFIKNIDIICDKCYKTIKKSKVK